LINVLREILKISRIAMTTASLQRVRFSIIILDSHELQP
jgi:hypothetical protein